VIGGSLYIFGRLARRPDLTDFAWHGTEAVLRRQRVTGFLKGTLGRSRPFVSNDSNPRDFRLGGGFGSSDRQSFPSGHTTTAFAAAAAVTSEIRRLHPKRCPTWPP
jgi:membrane-associated phospholipid phosphatase